MPVQNGVYIANQHLGINRAGFQHNMDMGYLWDVLNGYIHVSKDGRTYIQQRYGLSKYNSATILVGSTTKVRYLFEAKWDDGTTTVFARAGAGWYTFNTGTLEFDLLDGSRTADAKGFATMYENNVVMTDGGNVRVANSSLSLSTIGNGCPTDATTCWTHGGRLWVNSAANPMKAYASKVGDHTVFNSTSDSVTLDLSNKLGTGDTLLGYGSIGQTLLVMFFKEHILVYNAPEVFSSIEIAQVINIGAVSQYGSPRVGNFLPYLSKTGVRTVRSSETSQELDTEDVTALIAPFYRDVMSQASDQAAACAGFYSKLNHYYFTIHGSDTHTFVYNIDLGQVVGRYQFHADPYSFLELRDGTFLIGMDNGYVYKAFASTYTDDDDTAINFNIQTPYYGSESTTVYKAIREFEMLAESNLDVLFNVVWDFVFDVDSQGSGNIQLPMTVDAAYWDEAQWDDDYWDSSGVKYFLSADPIGRGRLFNLNISHANKGAIVRIVYWVLRTILEGRK